MVPVQVLGLVQPTSLSKEVRSPSLSSDAPTMAWHSSATATNPNQALHNPSTHGECTNAVSDPLSVASTPLVGRHVGFARD